MDTPASVTLHETGWTRLAPFAGIVFAILLVAGFVSAGESPDYTDAKGWEAYFSDSGNRTQRILASYLLVIAGFAFLWFVTGLVNRLRAVMGDDRGYSTAMLASGLVSVVFQLAAATTMLSVPASITFGSAPVPTADLAIQLEQLGIGLLLVPGLLSAALFVALTLVAALRTGILPNWLAWFGFVVAGLLLLGPLFLPAIFLPLWALILSIVWLTRAR